jgi:hypothetical protein
MDARHREVFAVLHAKKVDLHVSSPRVALVFRSVSRTPTHTDPRNPRRVVWDKA